jgi:spermidine synthase
MSNRVLAVVVLLFLAGMCALIFQIGWLREFRLVFGATTAASAAVLAIFMGGLGLGNALLGRRADSHPNPLRFYAVLELLIALSAGLSPYLIDLIRAIYVSLGGQTSLGLRGATLVRLLLSTVVLGVPTLLMGGTLPAAAKAVTAAGDRARRSVGLLYGFNTIGAVVGASLATFFMLEQFGTRLTLWLACLVNLALALTAYELSRTWTKPESSAPDRDAAAQPEPEGPAPVRAILAPAWAYAAAGIVGFTFFLMELVWFRMLGPLLGGTTFTFGLILAVALAGIGLGGAAYALLFRRLRPTVGAFGLTCGLEAACIALPFAVGDHLAILALLLRDWGAADFAAVVLGWAAVAAIVVLPAAFVSGIQFPLLVALLGQGGRDVGKQVGMAFAWNTVGAILGSLAGGFGLLPALTAPGTWRAAVVLLSALGLGALLLSLRRERGIGRLALPVAALGLSLALIQAPGPTAVWRHAAIGTGRALPEDRSHNKLRDWMHAIRRRIIWEAEGVESSVALAAADGLGFVLNGRSDGNAVYDAPTQVMLGILGGLLHPEPRKGLVVGLGSGQSAGWLAEVASIERVDVVELEPVIEEAARRGASANRNVLEHPGVRWIFNDAREVLLTSPERYDLIVSEPSSPYRAGVASLYTREFYAAVRNRLNEGGLFLQWLQAYEIDPQAVRTVLATLAAEFEHVEIWQTHVYDLLFVCSQQPMSYSVPALRERIQQEPFRSALGLVWRAIDLEGVLARYVAGSSVAATVGRLEARSLNTDDRNRLEYSLARSIGGTVGFPIAALREVIGFGTDTRPPVEGGSVDWERVEDQRQSMYVAGRGTKARLHPGLTEEQRRRALSQQRAVDGDVQGSIAAWRSQPREPIYPTEIAILAYALAASGRAEAVPLLDRLREFDPIEAATNRAYLLLRRGDPAGAAGALEEAFVGLRSNPWPQFANPALDLAIEVATMDASQAGRLYRALREPFALYRYEERRRDVAARLAAGLSDAAEAESLEVWEPHVPWTLGFLERRREAYRATGHPLASQAERDLLEYRSHSSATSSPDSSE